jgi:hypothetical protein
MVSRYAETYAAWQRDPLNFWAEAAKENRLPKTRSGKILRGTMKKIADNDAWTMPATIDDPAVLSEIAAALQRRLSRAESILQELRNEVRNLAFAMWAERVQGGGSYLGDAWSDWFAACNQLGIPSDLLL